MWIQRYITACWFGSSRIKSSDDQNPVLYINMLASCSGIKSTADQDPVLSNIMLTRFV